MSTEANKQTVRSFFEAMSAHDVDAVTRHVAEDLVNHAAIPEAQGRAGLRTIGTKIMRAFPDSTSRIEDIVAEGDRVTCRVVFSGTNEGPLDFVRMPLAATGRRVTVDQIHIFRLAGGVIVEHWACRDDVGMMRQLGVATAPR